MKFVGYLRVLAAEQRLSGLGLEAQHAAISAWINAGDRDLVEEVVEIESDHGRRARPALARACEAARLIAARLVIGYPDCLSEDPVFLLGLRESGVDFVGVDMVDANWMDAGNLASAAEQECKGISQRVKPAPAAAEANGSGNSRPETARFRDRAAASAAGLKGGEGARRSADAFAASIRPVLEELAGLSANQAAQELNHRCVQTARGGRWTARSVLNVRMRLEGAA